MVQCPDLLVYHPDLSDWFFCEVKGPRDSLRPEQIELFREMEHTTGKDVYVVNFGELKNHRFLDNNLLTC